MIQFSQLEKITGGKFLQFRSDSEIQTLITDSRKSGATSGAIFFAIGGERHDGHEFVGDMYAQGVRNFVIEKNISLETVPEANIIQVNSSISALQNLAAFHRSKFDIPVVGITGSNGKTIVKEWLYQLLSPDFQIAKNPGSYNSQIGVPLSVWQLKDYHRLGIFEAGISRSGEMSSLKKIIQPTHGIFTNLGSAHDEGFGSVREKLDEKLKLFADAKKVIYCSDHTVIDAAVKEKKLRTFTWGYKGNPDLRLSDKGQVTTFIFNSLTFELKMPFANDASRENLCHCIACMVELGIHPSVIQARIDLIKAIPMRLELKDAIHHSQLIDDTYNNDLAGLKISLDFLAGLQRKKKTVILSEVLQSGLTEEKLANAIYEMVSPLNPHCFIGIGSFFVNQQKTFERIADKTNFFRSTDDFLKSADWSSFQEELILVKGARLFQFERIVKRLQSKIHGTVMEVDFNRLIHNLNFFKSKLKPSVKVMVMVKAFAYGSGSEEVANLLQYHKVDYLGVAYADEGVALRKNEIKLPIMVMNATSENYPILFSHDLEPVIFTVKMLRELADYAAGEKVKVHLEFETGMQRLGLEEKELPEVIEILKDNANIKTESIFSHLAGADDETHDTFSKDQIEKFERITESLSSALMTRPLRHMLNSPGIIRFPENQYDMVRLGIGLYGVNPTTEQWPDLKPAVTLKTVVSQIKTIRKGETVGYGRRGVAERDLKIATIAIGYADGFSRAFSRGKGKLLVNGKVVPVIGNVCMDMTMIDVTDAEVQEGDEVIVFGNGMSIDEVAERIDTIPYEILASTSQRIKRVFFAESI